MASVRARLALVLAVHIADLTRAGADVAGRDVGVRADVFAKLGHKALAEAHHFPVALALGVEVRAALGAAHGEGGQAVLEHLLEAQELNDGRVDGRMQPDAALIRADGGVELEAVAAVDLHLAAVVHPRDAEHDHPLGLDDPFYDAGVHQVGTALQHKLQRFQHFLYSLLKLRLVRVAPANVLIYLCEVCAFKCHRKHLHFLYFIIP